MLTKGHKHSARARWRTGATSALAKRPASLAGGGREALANQKGRRNGLFLAAAELSKGLRREANDIFYTPPEPRRGLRTPNDSPFSCVCIRSERPRGEKKGLGWSERDQVFLLFRKGCIFFLSPALWSNQTRSLRPSFPPLPAILGDLRHGLSSRNCPFLGNDQGGGGEAFPFWEKEKPKGESRAALAALPVFVSGKPTHPTH